MVLIMRHVSKPPRTCPDCDAPIGDDMMPLMGCWYWGQRAEQMRLEGKSEEFIADWLRRGSGGGDPPCSCNSYNQWSTNRGRRAALTTAACVLFFIGFLCFMVWAFP